MNVSKNGKRIGRPPGSKNAATILKESGRKQLTKAAEDLLYAELPAVTKAMVKAAKSGNVQAAKLIYDRVLPTETSGENRALPNITINVERIDYAETDEPKPLNAERQIGPPPRTFEVEAQHADEAGRSEDETGSEVEFFVVEG